MYIGGRDGAHTYRGGGLQFPAVGSRDSAHNSFLPQTLVDRVQAPLFGHGDAASEWIHDENAPAPGARHLVRVDVAYILVLDVVLKVRTADLLTGLRIEEL
ncbi:hypothetical protein DPMN_034847 [Dreissena polymorpha]|uniref:Uncharacterized protein n=1 Tax=Dreissena polymorpha TaxID=45954 RepID=A0A9D4M6F8_DREPO|nr:hypothetical protein DPMN_034847 [Dreissena polymorpha]